jgi:drug/metabolite transporter (DMT)-like permease
MIVGILFVLSACFVWGLIFVIPQLLIEFSPFEVALGRYLCFGLISLLFMLIHGVQKWRLFSTQIWINATFYALVVNILYYSALVVGLRYSSASVIALILGISPITISFYGNWQQKECRFRDLILPSCLILIGLILVNIPAFNSDSTISIREYLFGLLCGCFSLLAWSWYVVSNAKFLKKNPQLLSSDWATLIGVGTLFWVMILGGLFLFVETKIYSLQKYFTWNEEIKNFLIGILILGLICSWLGSYLWNKAAKSLPVSLAGQLTIFETIFGLIFVYLVERRFPLWIELAGMMMILISVALSMNIFRKASLTHSTSENHPSLQVAHS